MATCLRCGNEWTPRKANPRKCPSCLRFLNAQAHEAHLARRREYRSQRTPDQVERERVYARNRYRGLPPEKRAAHVAKSIARVANLTGEKLQKYKAYQTEYKKNLTPEQRIARREYNKTYSQSIPEEKREIERARWREWKKTWTEEQRKARSLSSCAWAKRNPDKARALNHRRKCRIRGVGGLYTAQEWAALKESCGHRCVRCGRQEPEIKLTVDHIVPVSKGGPNIIGNIQPLCLRCNISKRDKIVNYLERAA